MVCTRDLLGDRTIQPIYLKQIHIKTTGPPSTTFSQLCTATKPPCTVLNQIPLTKSNNPTGSNEPKPIIQQQLYNLDHHLLTLMADNKNAKACGYKPTR